MRKFLLCTLLIFLFSCQASAKSYVIDTYGTLTANAGDSLAVSADSPPVITTQPMDCSVIIGETAMFSITAVGSEPLTYQWQIGVYDDYNYITWSDIIGATFADYTSTADYHSYYRVVVSNSYGSITSDVAQLGIIIDHYDNRPRGENGCNSGGVLGILTLFPVLLIFCRKKN